MAELIKRQDAIDVLKETGIIQDNDLGHLVVEEIERIPTTTEAEIRAKAIDEFAEKLKIFCESTIDESRSNQMALLAWQITCAEFKNAIDEIAEQLKEE